MEERFKLGIRMSPILDTVALSLDEQICTLEGLLHLGLLLAKVSSSGHRSLLLTSADEPAVALSACQSSLLQCAPCGAALGDCLEATVDAECCRMTGIGYRDH